MQFFQSKLRSECKIYKGYIKNKESHSKLMKFHRKETHFKVIILSYTFSLVNLSQCTMNAYN